MSRSESSPQDPDPGLGRGPARKLRRLVPILVAAAWVLTAPGSELRGQEPGIRVVELFHPESGTRERRVVAELNPGEIAAVQRALAEEGHPTADDRGVLGPATRSALERFQEDRGLEACRCPSYETILALGLRPLLRETVVVSAPPSPGAKPFRRGPEVEVLYGLRVPEPPSAGRTDGGFAGRPDGGRADRDGSAERPASDGRPTGRERRSAEPARHDLDHPHHPLIPVFPGVLPPPALFPGIPEAGSGTDRGRSRRPLPFRRVPLPPIRPPIRSGGGR